MTGKPPAFQLWISPHTKGATTLVEIAAAMIGEVAALLPGRPIDVMADRWRLRLAGTPPAYGGHAHFTQAQERRHLRARATAYRSSRPAKETWCLPAHTRGVGPSPSGPELQSGTPHVPHPPRKAHALLPSRPVVRRAQGTADAPRHRARSRWPTARRLLLHDGLEPGRPSRRRALRQPLAHRGDVPRVQAGPRPRRSAVVDARRARARAGPWLWSLLARLYLVSHHVGTQMQAPDHPWYPNRSSVSFLDALAALRRALWPGRISARTLSGRLAADIPDERIEFLAYAA